MTKEIENAIIVGTEIEYNHGMLTLWLRLDYGGIQQGFGGYSLFNPKFDSRTHSFAGFFLHRVLEITGAVKWSQVRGKTVRVERSEPGLGGNIQGIGHIVKDVWFFPGEVSEPSETDNERD